MKKFLKGCFFLSVMLVYVAAGMSARAEGEAPAAPNYILNITTDRPEAVYKVGEKVIFTVNLTVDGKPGNEISLPYQVRQDDWKVLASGELSFVNGNAGVTAEFVQPSFLLLVVDYPRGDKPVPPALAGAGAEPEKIAPSMPKPDDFNAFWDGKKKIMDAMPFNAELKPVEHGDDVKHENIETYEIVLDSINGSRIHGYFAKPVGAGPFPALMLVHGAGIYSITPVWAARYASRGAMVIDINAHDIENGKPREYYEELRKGKLADYVNQGRDDRDTSYFLRMFCSCYRAAEYLASRPDWDKKHMVVSGQSQGGAQAIATAGLCRKVTAVTAAVPAMCDHTGPEAGRLFGWPALGGYTRTRPDWKADPKKMETSRYYDGVNFAQDIRVPVLFGVGFLDRACPPGSVYAAFNQLKGSKTMVISPGTGHTSPKDWKDKEWEFISEQLGVKK